MFENVLIISASSRIGSNSDILCDQFIKGATESGNRCEKILLREKKINYCSGCGVCIINNYKACSQHDDMEEILDKIIKASVVVFASPIYFYTVNAQMKNLIDRCCARHTKITNKDFYYIVTAADTDIKMTERSIECFRGFTDCLENIREKGIIRGTGLEGRKEVLKSEFMEIAYNMGKNV